MDLERNRWFPSGHQNTDFERWYRANSTYYAKYEFPFEPYFVADVRTLPRWDERFRGYGEDKAQQVLHMARAGFKFVVLPDKFVMHREHEPSDAWAPDTKTGMSITWCNRMAELQGEFDREFGKGGY